MKKLPAILIGFFALAIGIATVAVPTTAYADQADTQAMSDVTGAIDGLYKDLDASVDTPNEAFFPVFADKLDNTRKVVSRAYADMGHTTEYGDAAVAIQDIRASLSDMKKQLTDWENAARAGDAEKFDAAGTAFSETADEYGAAVDAYNNSAPLTEADDTATSLFLIALATSVIAIPIVLARRNKTYKAISADSNLAHNKTLVVSRRKFWILNIATLGMYLVYWVWQQWEVVAKTEDKKYHSTIRAIFMWITSFKLLPKLLAMAKAEGYNKIYKPQRIAWLWLVLLIGSNIVTYQTQNIWVFVAVVIAEVTLMTATALPVVDAQNHYYTHTKKVLLPAGRGFAVLTWATIAFAMALFSLAAFNYI